MSINNKDKMLPWYSKKRKDSEYLKTGDSEQRRSTRQYKYNKLKATEKEQQIRHDQY